MCHSEEFCSWEALPSLSALCSLLVRTEVELNMFIMEKINFCFCFVVFCVCLSCEQMMNRHFSLGYCESSSFLWIVWNLIKNSWQLRVCVLY